MRCMMDFFTLCAFLRCVVFAVLLQVLLVDVMAEQILDFEKLPPVPSTKQFVGTLRSGSSRFIPDYVHGMAGLPSMADKGDEVFVTRGLLIRMTEPRVGDGDSGRRGGDRSHVALRAYTPVSSPNTATFPGLEFPGLGQLTDAQKKKFLRPEVALKSADEEDPQSWCSRFECHLGFSQAASGFILAIGYGNTAIVSSDVDRGAFFYENDAGLKTWTVKPEGAFPFAVASEEMACFSTPAILECFVMDLEARTAQRAWWDLPASEKAKVPSPTNKDIWTKVSPTQECNRQQGCVPPTPCTWDGVSLHQVCKGEAAAAWKRATAVLGTAPNGKRFVKTAYAAQSQVAGKYQYSWVCTSGCSMFPNSQVIDSNMTSPDPTYGKALAMHGNMIAVGSPGTGADGRVDVYVATGDKTGGASGYEQHRQWERVAFFPPLPQIGFDLPEYTGQGFFGSAVSLSSKWLVIGAPGSSGPGPPVAGLVRIYKVTGSSFSQFCEVKHPDAAISMFGSSISQASHASWPWTIVLVGAYGENLAYSILLRSDPPLCKMHEVFAPPSDDVDQKDYFGYSVAISKSYAFIGAPNYLRWYKKDVSGLLYSNSFCFPGDTRVTPACTFCQSMCFSCARNETSDGGSSAKCRACLKDDDVTPLPIPQQSTLNYGCSYVCNEGYFGNECLTCSQFSAPLANKLPANALWVDGEKQCRASCIGGFFLKPTDDESKCDTCFRCLECASQKDFRLRPPGSVQWIVGGTCEFKCVLGLFPDPVDPEACKTCSELKISSSQSPPVNAEWVDRLSACQWAPKLGFNCTSQSCRSCPRNIVCAECKCTPCENKPALAVWAAGSNVLSPLENCNFVCLDGLFGHPVFNGLCVDCPTLQSLHLKNSLPSNAFWDNNPDSKVCNLFNFTCNDKYRKSISKYNQRFCCPDTIPDSFPNASAEPCGVTCNPGFYWNIETGLCSACAPKQNSDWLRGCDFKCRCDNGTTGTCYWQQGAPNLPRLDNCYTCDAYHNAVVPPTYLPTNAQWHTDPRLPKMQGVTPGKCDESAWRCNVGFTESNNAVPPGCCPDNLGTTNRAAIYVQSAQETCKYECVDGYKWNKELKNCSFAKNPRDKIANSKWNYRTGVWVCLQGFVPIMYQGGVELSPSNPIFMDPDVQVSQCMECFDYAKRQGWQLPSLGYWLNSSQLSSECSSSKAFACTGGYIPNPNARLCCPPANLPDQVRTRTHQNGEWDSQVCEYRCVSGKFPVNPTRTNGVCMKCKDYFSANDIPFRCDSSILDARDRYRWCEGVDMPKDDALTSACTASIRVTFSVSGITLSNFTTSRAYNVMRAVISEVVKVDSSQVMLSTISRSSGNVGAGRRQIAASSRLAVAFLLRYLDPDIVVPPAPAPSLAALLSDLGPTAVGSALNRAWTNVNVGLLGEPLVGPSSETWKCAKEYTKNDATGRCCRTQAYQDPSGIDPARFYWQEDGCQWQCLESFRGAGCLSCTEFNKDKYRPDNSMWDDESPTCTNWKCRPGYIRSDTGYSCLSIKQLEGICSAKTRCATCVGQGNCVWCGNRCLPGESDGKGRGCPFFNSLLSPNCNCEASSCSQECLYTSCSSCIKDAYCGWCASSEKCMLGSYFSPLAQLCTSGWSVGSYTQCGGDQNVWLVGVICAAVSTTLVLLMCLHFILRVRAMARLNQLRQPVMPFGSSQPVGASPDEAREAMARFLETFPTFKYSGDKSKADQTGPPQGEGKEMQEMGDRGEAEAGVVATAIDPGDNEPACSICLGNFVDGEECRMLKCLHVFHKACIDHWLNVSQECPLCKRSVMRGSTNDNPNFAAEQARFGNLQEAGSEEVDIAV